MSAPPALAPESIDSQAAGWFARRRSGEMSAEEAAQLDAWLDADPAHRAAFDAVGSIWSGFELTRDAPEILAMRAIARRKPAKARGRAVAWRIAAALALVALSGFGAWTLSEYHLFGFRQFPDQTFHTEVGQRSTVTLPDGSVVTLNTDTVLRTRASKDKRLIFLDRGQAYFKVAHDRGHPFIVAAAGRTITAVGTAFDVRADPRRFEVTLVEGKVRVETPLPPGPAAPGRPRPAPTLQTTEMVAGSQFTAADDNRWSVARADTAKETTWLTGWLKFENEPLAQVVEELDRYSDRKVVLDDPSLATMPVSGRFKAGDVDGFVHALEIYHVAPTGSAELAVVRLARREDEKS